MTAIAPTTIGASDLEASSAEPDTAWNAQVEQACQRACQAIAPTWPLDRAIAVNPHWSRVGMPLRRVAARMAVLGGMHVFPPRARQLEAWRAGRITPTDLALALQQVPAAAETGLLPQHCLDALRWAGPLDQLPLLIDLLDDDPERETRLSWRQALTHQVSQTCAAYFDEHQADWQPDRTEGLYAFWRDTLLHDHGIGQLMGLPQLGRSLAALPATARDAERWALRRLDLPPEAWADYLESVLLTVNGWASWCAYLGWQAGLAGRQDGHLRELLALRLAWGAVLLENRPESLSRPAFATLQRAWGRAGDALAEAERAFLVDEVWQTALEIGYQRELTQRLRTPGSSLPTAVECEVQAAFCIDVRSEPLRRALETVWPAVQTRGFAGFFGLPIAYTPLGTEARRPQLPGLLAPALEVTEGCSDDAASEPENAVVRSRRTRLALREQWRATSRWPGAAFSFVEAAGFGYLGQLGRWLRPGRQTRSRDDLTGLNARQRRLCRPRLTGLDDTGKVALAAKVLHALGLERDFAPLVLLAGHGSQSANNAHAAALDCGACCGQTGEVNARTLAQLLNDPEVRLGLRAQGVELPASTTFVAALHNTTTDEIEGFDLDLLPAEARVRWERLQPVFAQAGDQVRRLRAASLGLDPRVPAAGLLDLFRRRANDGAQTRPEWGLTGNAAFLIGPRARSRGVDLGGRAFLHDYDAALDPDNSVLELLLTAPMLVTHWINWQYHASTCEPEGLGSGNKVLHNVVGGNLGVFEGNGGDLRIGLSRQSMHDGTRWRHEPLRLTVIVDAPRERIDAIVAKHPVVRQLVEHGWLHLWRWEGAGFERWDRGQWTRVGER